MSGSKRFIEEDMSKRHSAIEFAISKGVLRRCEFHAECVLENGGDIQTAYKAAAYEYARGRHREFSNQLEFTDYIKLVVEANFVDECPCCESMLKD